eukprot:scaffold69665_cov22-Prasinocladus_malaysianus.AAC.1
MHDAFASHAVHVDISKARYNHTTGVQLCHAGKLAICEQHSGICAGNNGVQCILLPATKPCHLVPREKLIAARTKLPLTESQYVTSKTENASPKLTAHRHLILALPRVHWCFCETFGFICRDCTSAAHQVLALILM